MKPSSEVWYNADLNTLGVLYYWGRTDLYFETGTRTQWGEYMQPKYSWLADNGWRLIGYL